MRAQVTDPSNAIERKLAQAAQQAWTAMPSEVRIAMRRRLFQMAPIQAIKAVGPHYKDGAWSITPYPGATGFGELGLVGCKIIHDKLCERDL
ncbi:MAG: hypothetical protein AAF601_09515 [Pseudomonadota bacterium]